jgi:hypothetical protein
MANTMTLISSVTVGSGGAATMDFTSIPSTYTDLILQTSLRDNYASVSVNFGWKLNGSTSNFSGKNLNGSGTAAASGTNANELGFTVGTSGTANTFSSSNIYLPNYASSNYKSYSVESAAESNTATVYMQILAGLWSNTAAITSISVYPINATLFTQYSTAYLYGVKNA